MFEHQIPLDKAKTETNKNQYWERRYSFRRPLKADSVFTLFKDGGRLFQAVIAVYEKLVVLSDACFETKKLPEKCLWRLKFVNKKVI